MMPALFRKYRILFYKDDCVHCHKYSFVETINMKLPIQKRIKMVNCTYYQDYGIITDPLIELFSKYFDGYPTLFIDGIRYTGANSVAEIKSWFIAAVGKDFINPETNDLLFRKECEFNRAGLLKGRIICR